MTDQAFADEEKLFLKRLADAIISEAAELQLPGAGDPQIFTRLLKKASGKETRVRSLMTDFLGEFGGVSEVAALNDQAFHDLTLQWEDTRHPFLTSLLALIAQAYYEDPRVLRTYNKDARAPFPEGNTVIQGDWSLLDDIRGRPPIYRLSKAGNP
jgi:hypothetical protein